MEDKSDYSDESIAPYKQIADTLFTYLHNVIYKPSEAFLDIESLPEAFAEFGRGLQYLAKIVGETRDFAKELAEGNLNCQPPSPTNEIASPLKMLHSSLRHLTWQTQQVAKGDYNQRVNFMGDFSAAFNNMIEQLEQRWKINIGERTRLEMYVHLMLLNCSNPILLFDSQGKLAYASDSYFKYFNTFNMNEIIGTQINDLFAHIVPEQSLKEIEDLFLKAISEEQMFKKEQEFNFKDSESQRHFEIQMTPMFDGEKKLMGTVLFFFDITESIRARLEAEQARELAEQSSRSKSNFLAKMSHEIRTPMNAILGMAELALREDVTPTAEEHIHTIKQAGANLLSIINDILDFSKIEAGKLEIVPMEYSFSTLINDVINIIKTRILETRLRFIVNIDCNIPNELFGDVIRIRQILLNLLSNAVKYTEKGFVLFAVTGSEAEDDTASLTIEITDSGKGLKPEALEKLFGEFTRFDAESNKNIEGTGLGLAICHSLVTAMGGTIEVKSEYGKGSSFIVTLPQKVRLSQKIAIVNNPGQKNILIFERRDIYANSIIYTMENLGLNYKLVSNEMDFFNCLVSNTYSFVFLAAALYDNIKKILLSLKTEAKFAVIVEFGEAITIRNMSTLTTPLYCLPVANFLNGIVDSYGGSHNKGMTKFIAPDAKIMVVDDVSTNLEVAKGLLLPYKMQVQLCKSGMEAIEEARSTRYDLVLMDVMMPEMDGIETVSHIRALDDERSNCKNLPIIALTADAVVGTKEMLLKNGFDDFLTKPIDITDLNTVLEKWIPNIKQKNPDEEDNKKTTTSGNNENEEIVIGKLNIKRGIALTGGKVETYSKMLSIFYKDGVSIAGKIRTCLETNNIQLFVIHVHGIKSASALIGAEWLSEAAQALESAGKREDWDFIQTKSSEFLEDLETLLENINNFLSVNTPQKV